MAGVTERLVTAREVGDYLGFKASTIVDWAEAGKVPAFKVGGRLRFRTSEVEAWLDGCRLIGPGGGGEAPTTPRNRPARSVSSQTPTTPIQGGAHA